MQAILFKYRDDLAVLCGWEHYERAQLPDGSTVDLFGDTEPHDGETEVYWYWRVKTPAGDYHDSDDTGLEFHTRAEAFTSLVAVLKQEQARASAAATISAAFDANGSPVGDEP